MCVTATVYTCKKKKGYAGVYLTGTFRTDAAPVLYHVQGTRYRYALKIYQVPVWLFLLMSFGYVM